MTTYEPGTVAIATVRGVEGVRVMRNGEGREGEWLFADDRPVGPHYAFEGSEGVKDIRPLVVLDADDAQHCLTALRGSVETESSITARLLIESVARRIREQTKPPRIPEPGWGEKVTASAGEDPKRYEWLHYTTNPNVRYQWVSEFCSPRPWDDLIDPTLVREEVAR